MRWRRALAGGEKIFPGRPAARMREFGGDASRALLTAEARLEFLAEEFEDEVADEGGEDGDGEVGEGEDVVQREGERLALAAPRLNSPISRLE